VAGRGRLQRHAQARPTTASRRFRDAGATANRELDNKLRGKWGDKFDANRAGEARVRLLQARRDHRRADGSGMGSPRWSSCSTRSARRWAKTSSSPATAGGGFGGKTPAHARPSGCGWRNDPDWMKVFNDPRHPQNKDYVAQRQALIDRGAQVARQLFDRFRKWWQQQQEKAMDEEK
jgi:hypothetical protein